MKPSKRPIKERVPHTPLDLHQFPLMAQADATPSRAAVRALAHPVTAPRQTKRRSEKNR
jgi:hypothetical protein